MADSIISKGLCLLPEDRYRTDCSLAVCGCTATATAYWIKHLPGSRLDWRMIDFCERSSLELRQVAVGCVSYQRAPGGERQNLVRIRCLQNLLALPVLTLIIILCSYTTVIEKHLSPVFNPTRSCFIDPKFRENLGYWINLRALLSLLWIQALILKINKK